LSDPNLLIDTPENIDLEAEIAGFGSRCMAALLDYSIMSVLLLGIYYLFARAFGGRLSNRAVYDALLVLIVFCVFTFYHLFFELAWNGQTPGKRRLGLRVVQANGLPLTTSSGIVRNLVRVFDFLPLVYGFGLISLFATRKTQRLGDLAARTVVIRERRHLTLNTLREDLTVAYRYITNLTPLPHYVQIDNLTETDRRDIVSYLQRRDQLHNTEQLSTIMAFRILRKMNTDEPLDLRSQQRAEAFLEQVARAFEIRERLEG
jgi:uncharacterized RDD family membrane protein YckC